MCVFVCFTDAGAREDRPQESGGQANPRPHRPSHRPGWSSQPAQLTRRPHQQIQQPYPQAAVLKQSRQTQSQDYYFCRPQVTRVARSWEFAVFVWDVMKVFSEWI